MSPDSCLWICTPVYLDVPAFLILRERISEMSRAGELPTGEIRFVVVDDTAGDDPAMKEAQELADVTVLTPPFNLGHQRALVFAVRWLNARAADDDVIVTMDSDGEDQPEDLPSILRPLQEPGPEAHTLVLALRTKRKKSAAFKLMYLGFRLVFRALTGTVVRTGNFAAYRGSLARQIIDHPHFDMCYSSTLTSLGLQPVLVPCERGARYAGRSRMNAGRLIMHGLGMLMPFTDRIAVRAIIGFSFIMSISVLAALAVLSIRLFTDEAIPGWATTTVLTLALISFVALGNLIVLFTVFSQARGASMRHLSEQVGGLAERSHGAARNPSP